MLQLLHLRCRAATLPWFATAALLLALLLTLLTLLLLLRCSNCLELLRAGFTLSCCHGRRCICSGRCLSSRLLPLLLCRCRLRPFAAISGAWRLAAGLLSAAWGSSPLAPAEKGGEA